MSPKYKIVVPKYKIGDILKFEWKRRGPQYVVITEIDNYYYTYNSIAESNVFCNKASALIKQFENGTDFYGPAEYLSSEEKLKLL
jgi:hypothetical protein